MPLAYELEPDVVIAQEAFTAAQQEQDLASALAVAWIAERVTSMSASAARAFRERARLDPPPELATLIAECDALGAVAAAKQAEFEGATRAAVKRLHPDLVEMQEALAAAEATLVKAQDALAEAISCADPDDEIKRLSDEVNARTIAVNRARRDVRRQVERDGLG
jgi:hypothetical protein